MTTSDRLLSTSPIQVACLAFPMMITALSGNLMLFLDRVILAKYSLAALNSVSACLMICGIVGFSGVAITSIAEVFVGQFNGGKQYDKMAIPVWQMLWLSFMLIGLCLPLAFFGDRFFIPPQLYEHGAPYYRWVMAFNWLLPSAAAISSFFIGRGLVGMITFAAIIGNIANLILDIILVFGISGWIKSMGSEGAAIATVISQLIQFLILLGAFLNKKNREQYATHRAIKWDYEMFSDCLRIGFPNALSHGFELAAWALMFYFMALLGEVYITTLSIGQSIFLLFGFVNDGLQKAVIAISSNLIGSKLKSSLSKLIRSSTFFLGGIFALLAIPLVAFPETFAQMFIQQESLNMVDLPEIKQGLFWLWIFCFFDGIVWILAGVLASAGDTKFIMIGNTLSLWIFAILPSYVCMFIYKASPSTVWLLTALYAFLNAIIFYLRYRSGAWVKLELVK